MSDHADGPWQEDLSLSWLQSFPIYRLRRRLLTREGFAKQSIRVLEAGSGPAHDSLVFAEKGADVTAVDISLTGLKAGQRIYGEQGYHIDTACADLLNLPFPNDTFDLVWNAGTLEHFDVKGTQKALAEMVRVTKPSGTVLVVVPNKYYFWYQWRLKLQRLRGGKLQYDYERALSVFELRRAFLRCGLHDVKASGDHIHPAPSFIVPRLWPITRLMEIIFAPLENSGMRFLQSLVGLEAAVWGTKPCCK